MYFTVGMFQDNFAPGSAMGETRNQSGGFGLSAVPAAPLDTAIPRANPVLALVVYLGVVFVGGALLAPWLHWTVSHLAPASSLATKPFHRYLDRSLMALAIAGIWPLLRTLEVKAPLALLRPAATGPLRRLAGGLAVGILSLGLVAVVALAAHARSAGFNGSFGRLAGKLAGAVGTAAAVALLEEFLFRGAIYTAIRRVWNWQFAVVISSIVFAVPHFLAKTELTGPVTWHSGLDLLPQMFSKMADPRQAIPALPGLVLVGIILAVAVQRSGDLYFSMGLHAGWVFCLKMYGNFTATLQTPTPSLWGTENIIDGWLGFGVLLVVLLLLVPLTPARRTRSAPS